MSSHSATAPEAEDPRSGSLEKLVVLLRRKLKDEGRTASATNKSKAPSAPPSSVPASAPARVAGAQCWLCRSPTESKFHLVDSHPLCLRCFQLCFHAVLRPLLMGDAVGVDLAQKVANAELLGKTTATAAAKDAVQKAFTEPGRWNCPRCTFSNISLSTYCEVCLADSPNAVKCNHCGTTCHGVNASPPRSQVNRGSNAAASHQSQHSPSHVHAKSICPSLGLPHEVWECEACTYCNTVDTERCQVCTTSRLWTCHRCGWNKNRLKITVNGHNYCTQCGHNNGPAPASATSGVSDKLGSSYSTVSELSASVLRRLGLDPEEAARERSRVDALEANQKRLLKRLEQLGLKREIQLSDGNCQFRALANQLFGNANMHMLMRHIVVGHMRSHPQEYGLLFESTDAFEAYLVSMQESATWGDELTLRAAADAFGVHLHIITSDETRWHLHFAPTLHPTPSTSPGVSPRPISSQGPSSAQTSTVVTGDSTTPKSSPPASRFMFAEANGELKGPERVFDDGLPHLLLLYLAPVHYDDVVRPVRLPAVGATLKAILEKIQADEEGWDDVLEHERSTHRFVEWVEVPTSDLDRADSCDFPEVPVGLPVHDAAPTSHSSQTGTSSSSSGTSTASGTVVTSTAPSASNRTEGSGSFSSHVQSQPSSQTIRIRLVGGPKAV